MIITYKAINFNNKMRLKNYPGLEKIIGIIYKNREKNDLILGTKAILDFISSSNDKQIAFKKLVDIFNGSDSSEFKNGFIHAYALGSL